MRCSRHWKSRQRMLCLFWQQQNRISCRRRLFRAVSDLISAGYPRGADSKTSTAVFVNKKELTADQDAIQYIARLSDGGMRDALSLLDQICFFTDGRVYIPAGAGHDGRNCFGSI